MALTLVVAAYGGGGTDADVDNGDEVTLTFTSWVVLFLAVVFFTPLGAMVVRSLTDPSPANYRAFVETTLYARVLWTTVSTSLVVTVVCLVAGYPYAYLRFRSPPARAHEPDRLIGVGGGVDVGVGANEVAGLGGSGP